MTSRFVPATTGQLASAARNCPVFAAARMLADWVGDSWVHDITLTKKITTAGDLACTAGEGACPPEDCGGVWAYAALKETLADPTAKGHDDMLEWMGLDSGADFDPAEFSVEAVNRKLDHLARRRG
ncbi:plasmid pRiA4b ORF-3 family protein [Actinosynnema sp. CA-248983]